MADLFGISNALRGVAEIYFRSARRSGRTTALLGSVKPGDVVVFRATAQAKAFERLCRERDIEGVKTTVVPPEEPTRIFDQPTAKGRLIWDHDWLEAHHLWAIDHTAQYLKRISDAASGPGEAHIQTQLAARERARWCL